MKVVDCMNHLNSNRSMYCKGKGEVNDKEYAITF